MTYKSVELRKRKPQWDNHRPTLPTLAHTDNNVLNETSTDIDPDNDNHNTTNNLIDCGILLYTEENEDNESHRSEKEGKRHTSR